MPLSTLPVEMHDHILSFLQDDRAALDNVSRLDKYYRKLALPFLYKDLHFDVYKNRYSLFYLLFTLLENPKLALYIDKFTLSSGDIELSSSVGQQAVTYELWKNMSSICNAINDIGGHCLSSDLLMRWLGNFTQKSHSQTNLDGALTTPLDGALAMVLCMATNLTRVDFSNAHEPITITQSLLMHPWTPRNGVMSRPFWKVEESIYYCTNDTPVLCLPSCEAITIAGDWEETYVPILLAFPGGAPAPAILRKLRVLEIGFDLDIFEQFLSHSQLSNLRDLSIISCPVDIDDPAKISNAICKHLPQLETFEWCRPPFDEPLGSFISLSKLNILKIAGSLMQCRDGYLDGLNNIDYEYQYLENLSTFLPPGLQELQIQNVSMANLENALGPHNTSKEGAARALEYLNSQIKELEHVGTIELYLEMGKFIPGTVAGKIEFVPCEPTEDTKVFLRTLVDALYENGIVLKIYRQESPYIKDDNSYIKNENTFIIGPKYTKPGLVWEDEPWTKAWD